MIRGQREVEEDYFQVEQFVGWSDLLAKWKENGSEIEDSWVLSASSPFGGKLVILINEYKY